MKKWFKTKKLFGFTAVMICALSFSNCKDEAVKSVAYDPSKPIEIYDFSPKEGGARTRLFIQGKNFGKDVSQIDVKIGGKTAKVIGSDGELIYCMVPLRATEGTIEVKIANQDSVKAEEKFNYISKSVVATLAGFKTEDGQTEVKDGTFDVAGFGSPSYMAVDPKNPNHIYFVDNWGYHLRMLDMEKGEVVTVMTQGEGNWSEIYNLGFTSYGDTLLIVNKQDADRAIAVSGAARANSFKRPFPITYSKKCTTAACHPINGEMYYSTSVTGDLYRYDWKSGESKSLYKVKNQNIDYLVYFHPTGNFAYIMLSSASQIMKSVYDWDKKELMTPNVFVGSGQWGHQDGQGTQAMFTNPVQGVFVKNPKYAGQADEYDFYFIDQWNSCVRYVTPQGFVFTYAGRGSKGVDDKVEGWIDGDLLEEARFNAPCGITYDEINKTFYIADMFNFRIRTIVVDE